MSTVKYKDQNGQWVEASTLTVKGGGSSSSVIIVDSAMSDTSENPVQNKVIKAYVDGAVSDIVQEIVKNEEVHAAALNDLNARIKELEERLKNAGL